MNSRKFKKGDKVCVRGLDMAFVFEYYVNDNLAQIFIEGESYDTMHSIIFARPEVILPNNLQTCIEEGWIESESQWVI